MHYLVFLNFLTKNVVYKKYISKMKVKQLEGIEMSSICTCCFAFCYSFPSLGQENKYLHYKYNCTKLVGHKGKTLTSCISKSLFTHMDTSIWPPTHCTCRSFYDIPF